MADLEEKYETIDTENIKKFSDLPLSSLTLKGLKECGYIKPTEIQRETIKLSLEGKDILGAAQTGSGKTLAFLIPILERLFCKKWTKLDGLGAMVITPTRELAYQIFEALRRIGEHHDFSAGLIIGGKDLKFERNRMNLCNIMICTPGRLLQHMDENPLFDCVNLQILVLDEADRCLDMGFEQTMNAIIANLPPKRQTLLFSATQTKSVKDLIRLSLKDPAYVSVHEHSEFSTPKNLTQNYMVCELKDKISILWSFIKNHLKQKIIIFFASCKQVKYVYEIFCKLRPGTSLLALYGTLHQLKRMDIYETFCRKQAAVLFATDLAARGLDFPQVNWVVQADCPEDSATYIHRVGRTARYYRGGESLLLLLDSETAIVDELKDRKIPIEKIDVNPERLQNPIKKMEAYLAKNPTLKDSAQRAFVSYAKAVFLMKNKKVFKMESLDTDSFAHSLGLAIPPRIRFLQRYNKQKLNNKTENVKISSNSTNNKKYFNDDLDDENDESNTSNPNNNNNSEENESDNDEGGRYIETNANKSMPFHVSDDSDSDDGILKVKRKDHDIDMPDDFEFEDIIQNNANSKKKNKPLTKAAVAKKLMKKKIKPNKKIIFDDDGDILLDGIKDKQSELAKEYENENLPGIDIEKAKLVLKEEDKYDKQLFKVKVKSKHKEEKRKLKEQKQKDGKQKDDESDKDEFGEDESDYEPDLDWLPDPDKIYGKTDENIEESTLDTFKGSTVENNGKEKDKRKASIKSKKRKSSLNSLEDSTVTKKKKALKEVAGKLNVNEAEELALLLLKNNS